MRSKHLKALAAFAFTAAPFIAEAGPYTDLSISTCTKINCSSETYSGTFFFDQLNQTLPFQDFFDNGPGVCMRIDMISQDQDTEMVLIAPDGTVYRNDDRAPGNLLPLIKVADNTSNKGEYSLQVSSFNGVLPSANFTFRYGLYSPATNPNCANPTPPLSTATPGGSAGYWVDGKEVQ